MNNPSTQIHWTPVTIDPIPNNKGVGYLFVAKDKSCPWSYMTWDEFLSEQPNRGVPYTHYVAPWKLAEDFRKTKELGVASETLKKLLDSTRLQRRLEELVPKAPQQAFPPYTPRAKKALILASKAAKVKMTGYVGTEHILYGLLQERDGLVARFLMGVGITLEDAAELIAFDPNAPESETIKES